MVIREEILVRAPLSVVWRVFSAIENWQEWNSVCRNCRVNEGKALSPGTCFTFTLRPYYLPIKVSPRVVKCEPGREVVWKGGRWGIYAEHTFLFRDQQESVLIISDEKFSGFMLWLSKLLFIPSRLHRQTRLLLSQVKKHAETIQ